jgi:hypothetical protein
MRAKIINSFMVSVLLKEYKNKNKTERSPFFQESLSIYKSYTVADYNIVSLNFYE